MRGFRTRTEFEKFLHELTVVENGVERRINMQSN